MTRDEPCEVCKENIWTCHDYRDKDGSGEIYYYCQGLIGDEYCGNVEKIVFDPKEDLADELYESWRDNQ